MKELIGIPPFKGKVLLSSDTMHDEEIRYVKEAFDAGWVTTAGNNVNRLEEEIASYIGCQQAVALSSGTAALHMCVKLAGERINPGARPGNALMGQRVFCSDLTFDATVNPIVYEGGEPIFIDTEYDTWNMDPVALKRAFELYPDVKIVVLVHLYGVPAKMDEIVSICREHGALIIEDAAEAMGAEYHGDIVDAKCGHMGDYAAISFNGNKIITGSTGGMFLSDSVEDANKVRKWSTQAREAAPWYQHEELGYNYRMSNVVAGIVRGNLLHIDEHIAQKKAIYYRYQEKLKGIPVIINPYDENKAVPNYWLSCLIIKNNAMGRQVRSDKDSLYISESGKSTPTEIMTMLKKHGAECRPIWKPMHMQPIYRMNGFITRDGNGRATSNAYIDGDNMDISADIFERGLCLPSDNKTMLEDIDVVSDIVARAFR